jgi:hypothetical protein
MIIKTVLEAQLHNFICLKKHEFDLQLGNMIHLWKVNLCVKRTCTATLGLFMAWSNAEGFYVHAIEIDFACDFTP